MNAVEFQAIVHNGVITLPHNQQSWNGKKIKVILLDERVPMQPNYQSIHQRLKLIFSAVQGFGKTGISIKYPYALRHGRIIADATLRYQYSD